MFTTGLVDDADLPMIDVHLHPHGAVGQPSPGIIGERHTIPATYSSIQRSPSPDMDAHASLGVGADDIDLTSLIAEAHRQRELEKSKSQLGVATDALTAASGEYRRLRWDGGEAFTNMGNNGPNGGTVRFDDESWDRATLTSHRLDNRSPIAISGHPHIHPPPKSAPLPTFHPFSDPKSPPLTTQAQTHRSNSGGLGNGFAQSTLYQPSPPTYPAIQGSALPDAASQVARHLEGLSLLLNPLLAQTDEVEKLRREVELWKAEWGRIEKEKRALESVVAAQALKPKSAGPPFTAVLIDGDGLIFQEHLIQDGFAGGQRAARTLLSALPTLAASASVSASAGAEVTVNANGIVIGGEGLDEPVAEDKELGNVVVQVFINKSGLGTALTKQSGLVKSYSDYDKFWQGFSAAHELFTVCDVGQGKEASDAKIREYLRLYARNAQCEMIVLGASHDNGYANILSSLQTESRLSKLLLLKGYSDLAPQLKQYSSRVVSIPDLFRTERIQTAPISFASIAKQPEVQSAPPTTSGIQSQTTTTKKKGQAATILNNDTSSEADTGTGTGTSEGDIDVYQWGIPAPVVSTSVSIGANSIMTKKDKGGKKALKAALGASNKVVGLNADDDWTEMKGKKKTKKVNKNSADAVRNLNPRPCHTYYLSPWGCKNGEDCTYGHEYDLNDPQLNELARLAKSIVCPFAKTGRCRFSADDCVYGHKCPAGDRCTFGDTCRFNELPDAHE